MLFSSLIFLYLFLPLTLLFYYLLPYRAKNYFLLLASLIFFAWGGVSFTIIIIISILVNYFFGLRIEANLHRSSGSRWLAAGVSFNVLLLAIYKYTDFMVENLNAVLGLFSQNAVQKPGIVLPIGISFYTFHSLSYLVDIYRKKTSAQKNVFNLALYITMFSQLIAGPIIRYSDVWLQLTGRSHNLERFAAGIERFLIGLAKKVLLANTFAQVADKIFNGQLHETGAANAWLGIVCYSLQIYYDFSGYSDMAIGLGRMFGFEFMENFNFPYMAGSVKEFWRRWHISLSTFFRDYVYIPLGGNQAGRYGVYVNLLIVFFLTGFWHGASWSFVIWGLFHGFFMIIERLGFEKVLQKVGTPLANIYTILVVVLAWVLFRADSLGQAVSYWKAMFDFGYSPSRFGEFVNSLTTELLVCLAIALAGALGAFQYIHQSVKRLAGLNKNLYRVLAFCFHSASLPFYIGILLICTTYLVAGTYNPFIYYRF